MNPEPFIQPDYTYRATLVEVLDGDTLRLDIDLGFGVWLHNQTVRLDRLDAPEMSTEEGVAAKDALVALLSGPLVIRTRKDKREKFGRWLAEVCCGSVVVNNYLLATGIAKPYTGGKRT